MKKMFAIVFVLVAIFFIGNNLGDFYWGKADIKSADPIDPTNRSNDVSSGAVSFEEKSSLPKIYVTYPRVIAAEGIKDVPLTCSVMLDLGKGNQIQVCAVYFDKTTERAIFLTEKDLLDVDEKVPEWAKLLTLATTMMVIKDYVATHKEAEKLLEEMLKENPIPKEEQGNYKKKDIEVRNNTKNNPLKRVIFIY